ncbi:MAG: TonB family protein [Candidatus Omnitrophica bacterium]|nr:TonB family protein [Candidatus Omnitrophota bacterium]
MDNNNKIFKITLLVSLILHGLILFPLPKFQKKQPAVIEPVFFNYLAVNIPQQKTNDIKNLNKSNIEQKKRQIAKKTYRTIKSNKKTQNPVNEIEEKPEQIVKTPVVKPEPKKEIITKESPVLPKKEEDLSKDKYYISYYRLINELLRDAVIYPDDFSEGEIALTFILNADGSLVNVDVLQDTSYNNNSLSETAKQIVKSASPFPPFPKELRQDQLTFNVVFCFRERS